MRPGGCPARAGRGWDGRSARGRRALRAEETLQGWRGGAVGFAAALPRQLLAAGDRERLGEAVRLFAGLSAADKEAVLAGLDDVFPGGVDGAEAALVDDHVDMLMLMRLERG